MEVESQSKVEWLCNKKLLTSEFEAPLDGLGGEDGGSTAATSSGSGAVAGISPILVDGDGS